MNLLVSLWEMQSNITWMEKGLFCWLFPYEESWSKINLSVKWTKFCKILICWIHINIIAGPSGWKCKIFSLVNVVFFYFEQEKVNYMIVRHKVIYSKWVGLIMEAFFHDCDHDQYMCGCKILLKIINIIICGSIRLNLYFFIFFISAENVVSLKKKIITTNLLIPSSQICFFIESCTCVRKWTSACRIQCGASSERNDIQPGNLIYFFCEKLSHIKLL